MKTHQRLLIALLCSALLSSCGGGGGGSSTTRPTAWLALAAGDLAQCGILSPGDTMAARTSDLAQQLVAGAGTDPRFLTLGDNVYNVGLLTEFQSCYEPTWGRLKAITLPSPGNHDYGVANAVGYYDYFGDSAGAGRLGYYRIDRGGWTIFSLNSNIDASASSAQATWLRDSLRSTQPCIAAYWHHPVFTSAARGDNAKMADIWSLLHAARADLILQGHEHHYERFAPLNAAGVETATGPASFVVGTGGAALSDFSTVRAGSRSQVKAFGVLRLEFNTGSVGWSFITLDAQTRDSGSISCQAKP